MQCNQCLKPTDLCVCSHIRPQSSKLHVLILQHPQEPDKDLGSARLAHLTLPNSTLKIGLSWPNLKSALGREAIPANWAVLYLGSGVKGETSNQPLEFVSRAGVPQSRPQKLEGIVILDGTWSQAKTLWWRNAWLLKLKRAILIPKKPSLYKELRKEPRKECLSTIETIAEALSALGEPAEVSDHLKSLFAKLLDLKRGQLTPKSVRKPR